MLEEEAKKPVSIKERYVGHRGIPGYPKCLDRTMAYQECLPPGEIVRSAIGTYKFMYLHMHMIYELKILPKFQTPKSCGEFRKALLYLEPNSWSFCYEWKNTTIMTTFVSSIHCHFLIQSTIPTTSSETFIN